MTKMVGLLTVTLIAMGCSYDTEEGADGGLATFLGRWVVRGDVAPCGSAPTQELDFTLVAPDPNADFAVVHNGGTFLGGAFNPETGLANIHVTAEDGEEERWNMLLTDDGDVVGGTLAFWRAGCAVEDGSVEVLLRERP